MLSLSKQSAKSICRETSRQPFHLASHGPPCAFISEYRGRFEEKQGEPQGVVFAFQIHTT